MRLLLGRTALRINTRYITCSAIISVILIFTIFHSSGSETSRSYSFSLHPLDFQSETSSEVWTQRAHAVKDAFLHAYRGYEKHAFPHDELKPVSNGSIDNFNGWGVTIIDSLDTMVLMGLTDEIQRAIPIVERTDFSLKLVSSGPNGIISQDAYAPFFETVIRYLGGLLSAYALTQESIFLQKADELGTKLSPAFDTPSGLPAYAVSPTTGKFVLNSIGMLAEVGSCQLEYFYLAQLTGKKSYYDQAAKIMDTFSRVDLSKYGMLPVRMNMTSGKPLDSTKSRSVGAAADSAHEYLLKYYLLTARTNKPSLDMYMTTVDHILTNLLFITPNRQLLYVTDLVGLSETPTAVFEHLSCFLPGLLALGVNSLPPSAFAQRSPHPSLKHYNRSDLHMWAAAGLAESCWLMYADQPTGLGPESVSMADRAELTRAHLRDWNDAAKRRLWIKQLDLWRAKDGRNFPPGLGTKEPHVLRLEDLRHIDATTRRDYVVNQPEYLLRPETIESMYILWKVTGDSRWRERGWTVFEAIEKEAKTPSGYASLKTVDRSPAPLKDEMPSYFLAETLKYLYLMFLEEDPVPLDRWVFNTEAHPLPIIPLSRWEKDKFGIPA